MFNSFSEYISKIIICVDVFECDFSHVNTFSKEVVFDIDMLDMLMERQIFWKINGGIVIG